VITINHRNSTEDTASLSSSTAGLPTHLKDRAHTLHHRKPATANHLLTTTINKQARTAKNISSNPTHRPRVVTMTSAATRHIRPHSRVLMEPRNLVTVLQHTKASQRLSQVPTVKMASAVSAKQF